MYWLSQLTVLTQISHIFKFHLQAKFYPWQQILSVVLLEMLGSCYSFCRNVQDRVMLTCLSIVLSRKNGTPWKNSSAGNSATQVLFFKTTVLLVVFSKSRHVLPISSCIMLEDLYSGLKFIKLVLFTTSSRIFPIQNKNKVPNWECVASVQRPTGQICVTLFFFFFGLARQLVAS